MLERDAGQEWSHGAVRGGGAASPRPQEQGSKTKGAGQDPHGKAAALTVHKQLPEPLDLPDHGIL